MYWFISLDAELWILLLILLSPFGCFKRETSGKFCDDRHYATNAVNSSYPELNLEYFFNMSTPAFDPAPSACGLWYIYKKKKRVSACSLVIPWCHWPLAMLFNFMARLKIKPSLPSHLRLACLCDLCVPLCADNLLAPNRHTFQHRPTSWTKRKPALLSSHTCSEALTSRRTTAPAAQSFTEPLHHWQVTVTSRLGNEIPTNMTRMRQHNACSWQVVDGVNRLQEAHLWAELITARQASRHTSHHCSILFIEKNLTISKEKEYKQHLCHSK